MLVKLFGIFDILTAIVFFINNTFDKTSNWFPNIIILVAAIYLIAKGLFFVLTADLASLMDIIAGTIMLISFWTAIPLLLAAVVIIYIIQKGLFSLVS